MKCQLSNTPRVFGLETHGLEGAWRAIQEHCPALSDWGIQTLRRGLDGFAHTAVLEPHYTCKDHRNLYSQFYSKKFVQSSCYCSRLHFFGTEDVTATRLLADPESLADSYLGFSVIRPVRNRCLGRTVLDPARVGRYDGHSSHCLTTRFRAHLAGHEFYVNGYPYMSQDAHANVCAHAALWTVCRYLSTRYSVYKEIYPYDIVGLTGHSRGRTYPYRGMTFTDYCEILSSAGCHPVLFSLKKTANGSHAPERFRDLCAYVESGFPVLASLQGHVIVLIGHTMDFSQTLSAADVDLHGYIDASVFWKQFVVVDDNEFPYAKFGYVGDAENYACRFTPPVATIEQIATAVAPLPEKAFLPADRARRKAMAYMGRQQVIDEISKHKERPHDPLVCRLLMTTNTAFRSRKASELVAGDEAPDQIDALAVNFRLPHFIWLMQISPLSLYKEGRCVAEIVLDSTAGHEEDGLLYMRTGRHLRTADKEENPVVNSREHFPLYRHNLGETVI